MRFGRPTSGSSTGASRAGAAPTSIFKPRGAREPVSHPEKRRGVSRRWMARPIVVLGHRTPTLRPLEYSALLARAASLTRALRVSDAYRRRLADYCGLPMPDTEGYSRVLGVTGWPRSSANPTLPADQCGRPEPESRRAAPISLALRLRVIVHALSVRVRECVLVRARSCVFVRARACLCVPIDGPALDSSGGTQRARPHKRTHRIIRRADSVAYRCECRSVCAVALNETARPCAGHANPSHGDRPRPSLWVGVASALGC